tara:strand:- start:2532 stop:2732 length:201 start_codon:yes stop_codon:yes gene_type:complete
MSMNTKPITEAQAKLIKKQTMRAKQKQKENASKQKSSKKAGSKYSGYAQQKKSKGKTLIIKVGGLT